MDAVVKSKWARALRSNRYKQTVGTLEDADGQNCCLGVLCRVLRLKKEYDEEGHPYFLHNYLHLYDTIPGHIKERVGLTDKQVNKLIKMNDEQGCTFKKIADYIERKL